MSDLLPRILFEKDPAMFRMDKDGQRRPDFNFCAHSPTAIAAICENAVKFAAALAPSSGRYFFWLDDAQPMCHCPSCRGLSDSDQALLLENAMVKALRRHVRPDASLAHLAYLHTLAPPTQVRPEPGVFLEYAPIQRQWSRPLSHLEVEGRSMGGMPALTHGRHLELLEANLAVFDPSSAQVLEYWLDVSLFSGYKRPPCKLPWARDVFLDDLRTYRGQGVRHITSFGAFLDAQYIQLYGEPPLNEYGEGLETISREMKK